MDDFLGIGALIAFLSELMGEWLAENLWLVFSAMGIAVFILTVTFAAFFARKFIKQIVIRWVTPSSARTSPYEMGAHMFSQTDQPSAAGNIQNPRVPKSRKQIPVDESYYEISEEALASRSAELGINQSVLRIFFDFMKQKQVIPEHISSRLRELVRCYKELETELAAFQSKDAELVSFKQEALNALKTGNFEQAQNLLSKAGKRNTDFVKRFKDAANKRLVLAAASIAEIGDLKNAQLDYQGAADCFREAAELLPEESKPILAKYLSKWSKASYNAGDYDEAEILLKHVLEIKKEMMGEDHSEVSDCLNNLALLYYEQGSYEEAEPLYRQALEIKEKCLGKDHPAVAKLLNNLAWLYYDQGRYEAVESLYQRSLEIMKNTLGTEHPHIAATLNNLGLLYRTQKKYAEAASLFKEALRIRENVLGSDHPDVARTYGNLAAVYESQDQYDEAKSFYHRALKIMENSLGANHPEIIGVLNALARIYYDRGDYETSEPLHRQALKIMENTLGPDHSDTHAVRSHLTELYKSA
jgi:tetratricopeptide (TPR) repeat protein